MAKRINVATNTLGRYEKGETYPTIETLEMLSSELDVSLDELHDEYTSFMINLPNEVISIRKELNLSAKNLGMLLGVNNARTVRDWQNGIRVPNTSILKKLIELKKAAT